MPQISPISWITVLILLIILITSTSIQITHMPSNPLPPQNITTNNNAAKW